MKPTLYNGKVLLSFIIIYYYFLSSSFFQNNHIFCSAQTIPNSQFTKFTFLLYKTMSYRGVIFNSHFSLFEKMGYLFLFLVDSFCIKIPIVSVLFAMPFSSKFYLLFAGNNFSIRWKKISSPNPRKNTFAKQSFSAYLCIIFC